MQDNTETAKETSQEPTTNGINQIYDKILKRILTLSSCAVVNLINGLFETSFPPESKITYNWTESVDNELGKTISDCILTIHVGDERHRFHIEAEIDTANTNDFSIVLRVFEYGYRDALKHRISGKDKIALKFPQPKIILLEHNSNSPDEVVLELDFGPGGKIDFTVPTMKFLDYSVDELNAQRMVILLPLYLLKLRKQIAKSAGRTDNKDAIRRDARELKDMIDNGIMRAIDESNKAGVIDKYDVYVLTELMSALYKHLYGGMEELKEEDMGSIVDGRLVLKSDILIMERDMAINKAKKETALANSREIARKLLAKGVSPEIVAEAANLPIEEVNEMQSELQMPITYNHI